MVKSLLVDPNSLLRRHTLELEPIPANRYDTPLSEERTHYGDARLVDVLRTMILIREVETMLSAIKRDGTYHDVAYVYRGPAHLSVGQEAAAAGQAFALTVADHTFGSHRSHGEIVAQGNGGDRPEHGGRARRRHDLVHVGRDRRRGRKAPARRRRQGEGRAVLRVRQ